MINTSPKVIAIIPARAGSKGLPGKNFRDFNGKPLISWTIEAAINSKCISSVALSSNDPEVLAIGSEYKNLRCINRPAELSLDDSTSEEMVLHTLKFYNNHHYFILLQPTSPLRDSTHIDEALQYTFKNNASSCVSICKSNESPFLMYEISHTNTLAPLMSQPKVKPSRRQDLPATYLLNGAIYINKISNFIENRNFIEPSSIGFIMNSEHSIDIDHLDDFNSAQDIHKSLIK
jgi:CMP-N,N'-diacetyllegionaminic acid synthase